MSSYFIVSAIGKIALVNGVYKGLGLEWCPQLGKAGYILIFTPIDLSCNTSTSMSTFYDRLSANHNYKSFKASATLEQFYTSFSGISYIKLSPFTLQYNQLH